jgi:DNA-directed RNA polymerase subunit M/transcription elongation factor TFIIS
MNDKNKPKTQPLFLIAQDKKKFKCRKCSYASDRKNKYKRHLEKNIMKNIYYL